MIHITVALNEAFRSAAARGLLACELARILLAAEQTSGRPQADQMPIGYTPRKTALLHSTSTSKTYVFLTPTDPHAIACFSHEQRGSCRCDLTRHHR